MPCLIKQDWLKQCWIIEASSKTLVPHRGELVCWSHIIALFCLSRIWSLTNVGCSIFSINQIFYKHLVITLVWYWLASSISLQHWSNNHLFNRSVYFSIKRTIKLIVLQRLISNITCQVLWNTFQWLMSWGPIFVHLASPCLQE